MVHEDGVPAATTPPRNTVMTLDGIGFVILNEQFCDGSAFVATLYGNDTQRPNGPGHPPGRHGPV